MYTAEELTNNIKIIAEREGYNLKKLAIDSGMSINALYQIRGEQGLSCFNLAKIADTLGCTTDELLGR